ncbi:MAG TPA: hypothetical protein VLA56_13440 [Pseudomonadales bacterium]|nr:hypothetical protein [Pseudomonadales bacterium]
MFDRKPAAPPVRSLAILPFLAADHRRELLPLAQGLPLELCHALSGTPGLRLASPGATARFAGLVDDPVEVGAGLHVEAVLVGTLRGAVDEARLEWSLVDVASAQTLDADRLAAAPADLIACLDVLLTRVASALDVRPDPQALSLSLGTTCAEALGACLTARFEFARQTEAALERAEAGFERAIELDPEYLGAHVGLHDTGRALRRFWKRPDAARIAHGDALLARIRELDPSGQRLDWERLLPDEDDLEFWDIAGHEARRREAVRRNRVDLATGRSARHAYADLLSESGLFRGALDYLLLCESEELPDAHLWSLIGHTHAVMGDLERAEARLREALEIDPFFVLGATYLIAVLDRRGRHDEARAELDRISDDLGPTLTRAVRMGNLHWRGARAELATLVAELEADPDLPGFFKGMGRLMLGEDDRAIDWFEAACRGKDTFLRQIREKVPFYLGEGPWNRLMALQRFRILLRAMNLDDRWREEHLRRANLLTPFTGIVVRG